MAIARGAGTEIIRSAHFRDVDLTGADLIIGVQHHIYTVLSVIIHTQTWQAAGNYFQLKVVGYDAKHASSDTAQSIIVCQKDMNVGETFVWNDKFSFNGFEPLDSAVTNPLSTVAEQDAIADQASAVPQKLSIVTENAADGAHVHVTYIDQNNA